jgi:hypothetical protein
MYSAVRTVVGVGVGVGVVCSVVTAGEGSASAATVGTVADAAHPTRSSAVNVATTPVPTLLPRATRARPFRLVSATEPAALT